MRPDDSRRARLVAALAPLDRTVEELRSAYEVIGGNGTIMADVAWCHQHALLIQAQVRKVLLAYEELEEAKRAGE